MIAAATNDATRVANFVRLFQRGPGTDLITNLDARIEVLECNGATFPLSISDPPNCYLCSPTRAYIDYGLEETRHFGAHPTLKALISFALRACRPIVRATGLDHQVQPNNWLISTNVVPDINQATAVEMRDKLLASHPDRAIVLRSLNPRANAATIRALEDGGFTMLPARQVYVVDPDVAKPPSADMRRDAKLRRETPYQEVDAHSFSADDWTRAAMLYHMLYVDKYTALNPQYTPGFLAQAHQTGLLKIVGLRRDEDSLAGVIGMFVNGQTMTVPLLGYDTKAPREDGLYRILNAIAQERATQLGVFYNLSAGAAGFKRHRNAVPVIEFTAVYVRHLGPVKRFATALLRGALTRIGVPVMQRFGL